MKIKLSVFRFPLFFLSVAAGLLITVAAFPSSGFSDSVRELLAKLAAYQENIPEDRVYVHLDKPIYKPGEAIWFSAYVRDGEKLTPSSKSDIVHVELINPKGGVERKIDLIAQKGVAQGDFQLGEFSPGGIYKLKAYTNWQKNDPNPAFFEKEFQVQALVLPRLKMKMDFLREAYGAGDEVAVELKLQTNDNQALELHGFDYIVQIGGKEIKRAKALTDPNGQSVFRFRLPEELETNDGLVNVLLTYQGQPESVSRSIPIVLNNIDVQLLPEGGDLVVGLPSKVGVKAVDEFGIPADIEGRIFDDTGLEVTQFSTYHQGMGAFYFTPLSGRKYHMVVTKPNSIHQTFSLPKPLKKGYVLESLGQNWRFLRFYIHSSEEEEMSLLVNVRGENYAAKTFLAKPGKNELNIPLRNLPIGVAQATLFDSKGIARAERLVFVNADREMKINVSTNKEKYLPREKVKLTIEVEDELGMPVPAVTSVAVVDDQLLSYADDKSSNILSWMLMEADLADEVYEPNFYFDPDEPKASIALDHLLLTSGWRRFTWKQMIEDTPVANISGEQALIGGTVVDRFGKPMRGARVGVAGTEFQQETDVHGRFLFKGIKLYEPLKLNVSGKNGTVSQIWVNSYHTNYSCQGDKLLAQIIDESGEPLIGANVVLANRQLGAVSDLDGMVDLTGLMSETGDQTITVSYVGYNSQQLDLKALSKQKGKVRIQMEEPATLAEQVVVTGIARKAKRPKKDRFERIRPQAAIPPPPRLIEPEDIKEVELVEEEVFMFVEDKPLEAELAIEAPPEPSQADEMIEGKEPTAPAPSEVVEKPVVDKVFVADREFMSAKDSILVPANPQIVYYRAREFAAPQYKERPKEAMRTDFRSTLHWDGMVEINRKGYTTVEFYTSDAISSYRVVVEGISASGQVGRGEGLFYTQLPFSLASKIPVELQTEDIVEFPLTLVNNTEETIDGLLEIHLPEGISPVGELPETARVAPNEAKTIFLKGKVEKAAGLSRFSADFHTNGFKDGISQPVKVVAKGFPANVAFSGRDMKATYAARIVNPVEGSLKATFTAYPSSLSEMLSGLESMLREPHGCFEQTSSSTYPNILVLQYLKETDQASPAIAAKASRLIEKGYKRLISFESKGGGFEWFGGSPAHEGLTAYGLMEFLDMQQVYEGVDQEMIDRTMKWLKSRRDGNGLFQRNPRALHHFGLTDNETMSMYIVYALSEGGITDLEKEMETGYKNAMKTKHPYQLALMANALYNYSESAKAKECLDQLMSLQLEGGSWEAKGKSAPGSGGKAYQIETAALALSALMKTPDPHPASVEKLADFLSNSRGGYGGFGNTNSTVLALRALVKYASWSKQSQSDGQIEIYVDGKKVNTTSYLKGRKEALVIDGLEEFVTNEYTEIKVLYKECEAAFPYNINLEWKTSLPESDDQCVLDVNTILDRNTIKLGETVRLTTTLSNKTDEGQAMSIAIVGIPAGLSLQAWQLKEITEKGQVDFYELFGNNLVLYYRQMAPSEKRTVLLDLKADIPGTFAAPATSGYLYYTNEFKDWTALDQVTILP